ncbi:hypothetical protein AB0L65_33100 [Nonomuraea sp. NPDC052116]|uniref:hypothetical protein n=1 Tax=Nonomuraea sp. NPDC052116 TaxID=3155665 RepID=UPI003414AB4B
MANLDTSQAISSEAAITYASVGGSGDRVKYEPGMFVIIRNGSGVSTTATITVPGNTKWGAANPVKTKAVAAGADLPIPLLPEYVDPADGRVAIACAPTTTISIAVMRA